MASLGTLIRLEFQKIIRRPMSWILGIIFFGFMGFMYFAFGLTLLAADSEAQGMEGFNPDELQNQLLLPDGLAFGASLIIGVGVIVMAILAAGSFGSEFSWATIRTSLLMRARRIPLLVSKLVVLMVMALILTFVGIAITIVGALGVGVISGADQSAGEVINGALLSDAVTIGLRTFIAIALWTLVSAIITLVTHSLATGIGITLATYFVGDIAGSIIAQLGEVGEYVIRFLPSYGPNAMLAMNQVSPPDYSGTEYVWIIGNLAVYTVVLLWIGISRFRQMDVVAASQ